MYIDIDSDAIDCVCRNSSLKGNTMKPLLWLSCFLLTATFIGCGGAPATVEIPEEEDTAATMSEDEVAAENSIEEPGQ